jgi:hypothetical protein
MHAARNAPRASGDCPKQALALSRKTSRRRGAEEPWGAVGAPGHASSLGPDVTQMVQAQCGGRESAGEAGLVVLDRWCPHAPGRWEGFLHLDGVALGADLGWGLLHGSGGHCTLFNEPGRVRTSDVQALEGGLVCCSGGAYGSGCETALPARWCRCIAAVARRRAFVGGVCPQVELWRVRKKWMVPV